MSATGPAHGEGLPDGVPGTAGGVPPVSEPTRLHGPVKLESPLSGTGQVVKVRTIRGQPGQIAGGGAASRPRHGF